MGSSSRSLRPVIRRIIASVAAVLVGVTGSVGLATATAAAMSPPSSAAAATSATAVRTGVDDFTFDSFDAEYRLGVDDEGRSTLLTTETLVARFPEVDQNRGIIRALVTRYQGHPTDLRVVSVTDAAGTPRDFELESDEEFLLVRSVADDYVHGVQTYVITYEQRNVTLFPPSGPEEFYWDTNGTGWRQPFGVVTARVIVDGAIAGRLTGAAECYYGAEGAANRCELTREGAASAGSPSADSPSADSPRANDTTGDVVFRAEQTGIGPFQNVTVAIGFEPGTFVPRDGSYLAGWAAWPQLIALLAAVAAAIWGIVLRATRTRDADGRPVIVAEYLPPRGADPLIAAEVLGRRPKAIAAQLLELAVSRHVRLLAEDRPIGRDRYSVELLSVEGLDAPRLEVIRALFGPAPVLGTVRRIGEGGAEGTRTGKAIHAIVQRIRTRAVQQGLRRRVPLRAIVLPVLIAIVAVLIAGVATAVLLDDARGGPLPVLLMIPVLAAAVTVMVCVFRRPLTTAGAELRDHLRGMELYIRVAEQERLRVLQSPQGAERQPVDPYDRVQVLRLHERMLPYAVLFGLERQWAAELANLYDGDPDWYRGSTPFSAVAFAAGVSSLSSAASSSYSGSSSSSSSGGSGGGGSSGGGGGGGGGGGA